MASTKRALECTSAPSLNIDSSVMMDFGRFMLNAERGDCGSVAAIIEQAGGRGRVQGDRWEHQWGTLQSDDPDP